MGTRRWDGRTSIVSPIGYFPSHSPPCLSDAFRLPPAAALRLGAHPSFATPRTQEAPWDVTCTLCPGPCRTVTSSMTTATSVQIWNSPHSSFTPGHVGLLAFVLLAPPCESVSDDIGWTLLLRFLPERTAVTSCRWLLSVPTTLAEVGNKRCPRSKLEFGSEEVATCSSGGCDREAPAGMSQRLSRGRCITCSATLFRISVVLRSVILCRRT